MASSTTRTKTFINDLTGLEEVVQDSTYQRPVPLRDLTPNDFLLAEAIKWIGTTEKGDNAGPEVERFQKAVDGVALRESWCMCFVQFCVKEVSARLNVQSTLLRGEHCQTVFFRSRHLEVMDQVEPGDIVVWKHGNTSQGHTGIVESIDRANGLLHTVEGNTGDKDMREGDGVYRKTRHLAGDGNMEILGYLRAFPKKVG